MICSLVGDNLEIIKIITWICEQGHLNKKPLTAGLEVSEDLECCCQCGRWYDFGTTAC